LTAKETLVNPEATEPTRALITSRDAFLGALRTAFALAARTGCRTLAIADETFAEWPLGDPAVIDQLTRWALPHRRFMMVAGHYDDVARRPEEGAVSDVPTLLVAEGLIVVRLAEPLEYRGVVSTDRADLVQSRETIDAVLQRSASAFPPTTLGL
jgi:hypothetical protein